MGRQGYIFLIILVVFLFGSVCYGAEFLKKTYELSNYDLSGTTYYLAYKTPDGAWYIKAIDTTSGESRVTFLSGGTTLATYSGAWTNRANPVLSGLSPYRTMDEAF